MHGIRWGSYPSRSFLYAIATVFVIIKKVWILSKKNSNNMEEFKKITFSFGLYDEEKPKKSG